MQSTSQPGTGGSSQPPLNAGPSYPGPNSILNPFADVANAEAAAAAAEKAAQTTANVAGGAWSLLSGAAGKLTSATFWKGMGLLAVASIAAIMGLWLWLGHSDSRTVIQMPEKGSSAAQTMEETVEA